MTFVLACRGIVLSDLTFSEEGNPNNTPEGLVNWSKRTLLASVLSSLKRHQSKCNYDFEETPMKDWCISFFLLTEEAPRIQ